VVCVGGRRIAAFGAAHPIIRKELGAELAPRMVVAAGGSIGTGAIIGSVASLIARDLALASLARWHDLATRAYTRGTHGHCIAPM